MVATWGHQVHVALGMVMKLVVVAHLKDLAVGTQAITLAQHLHVIVLMLVSQDAERKAGASGSRTHAPIINTTSIAAIILADALGQTQEEIADLIVEITDLAQA